MKIGTTTIPFLPLTAVVLAMLLVVLVLWGVRRVGRHPAPAAVPGARPAVRAPQSAHEPCAADWTGEVANGYAPAPAPVERARTVADAVAERNVDTSPLPVVALAPTPAAARPAPPAAAPRPGPVPDAGPAGPVREAGPAGPVGPGVPGAPAAAGADAPTRSGPGAESREADLSAPSDERPDSLTLEALHGQPAAAGERPATAAEGQSAAEDAPTHAAPTHAAPTHAAPTHAAPTHAAPTHAAPTHAAPTHAAPTHAASAHAGPTQPVPDEGAAASVPVEAEPEPDRPLPDAAPDPLPPPWSAARSEPADVGPEPSEPSDHRPGPDAEPTGGGEGDAAAEPVSRAVHQALAARAVQRARLRREDGPDDAPSAPEPASRSAGPPEQPGEHPLTVVPSASGPVAAVDARDRLLSVLLTDPARAVGATEDLDDARERIDQLGDVLRRRRADLALAVRRLHASGLDRDQIGRLAGMGRDDVAAILEARTGDGADGPRHT